MKGLASLFRLRWRKLGAATILACGVAAAWAAPNPISGPKSNDGFQTAAPHAILIDADSGSVLFEKAADDLIPPASLSKLMTAEVVFNLLAKGQLKPEQEFIVSVNAWRRGGAPSHTSSMFIPIHNKVSVDNLLHGVIIQSANDACIVLAEGISGSESVFAELMTKRARELGLTRSTFGNSNGLPDPKQLMTARELAKLARHIIQTYPDYYKYYGEREFTWNKIRQFNRNPLLALTIGADGLKTGFTKEAGYGLVGSAVQNGLRLIVVVNGLQIGEGEGGREQEAVGMGISQFPVGPSVCGRPGDRLRQALWRGERARAAQGGERGDADGAARLAREDHCARRVFRPGTGAGAGRAADRDAQGVAGRFSRAGSALAGG